MERPIEYWRDLYLLHSETKGYKHRIKTARRVIEDYLLIGCDFYVSLSGGKDSVALLHLVRKIAGTGVKVMNYTDDMFSPDLGVYISGLMESVFPDCPIDIIAPNFSVIQSTKGMDFSNTYTRGNPVLENAFEATILEWQERTGNRNSFIGLRAEESYGRRKNFEVRGKIYYKFSTRQLICNPLTELTGMDVMAYLFENQIPINDIYFKTAFHDYPHELRVGWLFPAHKPGSGEAVWLKKYYPEMFLQFCTFVPEIRAYV